MIGAIVKSLCKLPFIEPTKVNRKLTNSATIHVQSSLVVVAGDGVKVRDVEGMSSFPKQKFMRGGGEFSAPIVDFTLSASVRTSSHSTSSDHQLPFSVQ